MLSANRDGFTFPCQCECLFFFFPCFLVLASISNKMLHVYGRRHPCLLVPGLGAEHKYNVSCGFSKVLFVSLRKLSSIPCLLGFGY